MSIRENELIQDMSGNKGGVCKFEEAFKTTQQKMNVGLTEYSSKAKNHRRWIPGSGVNPEKRAAGNDKRRREERAEILMHLICWGPN